MLKILDAYTPKTKNWWTIAAHFCGNRACARAAAFLLLGSIGAFGQVTLSLSSASAVVGGSGSVDLSMSAAASQPAGLEWTYSYSTADFSSVSVVAGPAAAAAGKSLSCAGGAGLYTCLLAGLNSTAMAGGVIATATFTVSPSTVSTSSVIQLTNGIGVSASDDPLAVTATGGQVSISQPYTLTSLACTPATVITPGSAACTAGISAAAPAGGLTITTGLAAGSSLTIPSSVAVAAGSAAAGFTVNATSVSANATAVLVTTLNGTSQSFTLTLEPPPPPPTAPPPPAPASLTGLTCSPTTLASHASATCLVTLSAAAPSTGLTVTILGNQAALTVPTSVSIPAGSSSGQFSVVAGRLSGTQTATVMASLNGTSASFSLALSGGSPKHQH